MSVRAVEISVAGVRAEAEAGGGWEVSWIDQARGVARLSNGERSHLVLVEGHGADWIVTVAGRRIPVSVRTWRERVLAAAEVAARAQGGPIEIKATLPGLVVAIEVKEGSSVSEGDPLMTIEAMKMQNEVRAPRDGRVASVSVQAGQPVATGSVLMRLD